MGDFEGAPQGPAGRARRARTAERGRAPMHVQKKALKRRAGQPAGAAYVARWLDPSGRERSKSFRRKVDAEHFLATVTADVLTGRYVDPRAGRITVREYAECLWLPTQDHKASTRALYEQRLRL